MEEIPYIELENPNGGSIEDKLMSFDPEKVEEERFKARVNIICQKYEYGELLASAIEKIALAMAEYHGDPELVLKSLEECPIHIGEPGEEPNEYLSQYFPGSRIDFAGNLPAAFIMLPIINDGKIETKKIIYFKNFPLSKDRDFSDPEQMATLAHELGHLIGSMQGQPQIEENGDIRVDIGYSSEYYRQDENGQMFQSGSRNDGIEEMVNTVDTNEIMAKIFGDGLVKSREYKLLQAIAGEIPADRLKELANNRIHSNVPKVDGISPEELAEVCRGLDEINNSYTLRYSEMMARGGFKSVAENNTAIAERVVEILKPDDRVAENKPQPIRGEPWTDFPDDHEAIDELEPDIDGVPQTVWRGERLYLDNIDQLGNRAISTVGHEAKHNQEGKTFLARDKQYASLYAVGTDGVKFYDGLLPKEQIPIGVVYKINNQGNHLGLTPTDDKPDDWGPFAGKFREFTAVETIPPEDYLVEEIYIMDDYVQPNGHKRSDFRRPLEVFRVTSQADLPKIIEQVKRRINELDDTRNE